ncbi:MAG: ABC transporter permease [Saprospiraceae bacterium]|nr:ABC transporter permease [Saprospiraceae bacterium]
MLRNYIKIAWKVLGRNRFYTFISLFGISLTLAVLIIVSAFLDQVLNGSYPNFKKDRVLFVNRVHVKGEFGSSISMGSYTLYNEYIKQLKTPENMAMASFGSTRNVFVGNQKLQLTEKTTDPGFFEIMEFDFLAGGPYKQEHIDRNEYVAVISDNTANDYFGSVEEAMKQKIRIDGTNYQVIGVVKRAPSYDFSCSADVFLPYHLSKTNLQDPAPFGPFMPILLAQNASEHEKIKAELQALIPKVNFPPDAWYEELFLTAATVPEVLGRFLVSENSTINVAQLLYSVLFAAMLLFMLLPTLNLINLNTSRIAERASEIGVRKAFGATSQTLTLQFIVENIIITLIGGAIGLVLAFIVLKTIESSGAIPHAILRINIRVFGFGLFLCLLFGILSGVLPALRMSRLSIVNAIKMK